MLKEIEQYATNYNIPIMLPDGIDFLCNYIKENKIKNILEIGTAIGYSAIRMALVDENIKVTTIERDEQRYQLALKNIQQMNLQDRIEVIFGDGLEVTVSGEYDLIFIDASKGHSADFFNRYAPLLKQNGTIITDNLSFHGLVEDESLAITKNQKGLVKRIKKFIQFLDTNPYFETTYISIGDKISISKRKKQ